MVTPAAKRKAVAHLVDAHGMSERRACKAIGCYRMTVRYQTARWTMPAFAEHASDLPGAPSLRLSAAARSAQEGGLCDQPQEAVPALPGREACDAPPWRRKRAIGTRAPMTVPMAPNDRWSPDFVSDQLTDGRRFRILSVVDDCTRECQALVADTSLAGIRVARELDPGW